MGSGREVLGRIYCDFVARPGKLPGAAHFTVQWCVLHKHPHSGIAGADRIFFVPCTPSAAQPPTHATVGRPTAGRGAHVQLAGWQRWHVPLNRRRPHALPRVRSFPALYGQAAATSPAKFLDLTRELHLVGELNTALLSTSEYQNVSGKQTRTAIQFESTWPCSFVLGFLYGDCHCSGTRVQFDFAETPSTLMEFFAASPAVMQLLTPDVRCERAQR